MYALACASYTGPTYKRKAPCKAPLCWLAGEAARASSMPLRGDAHSDGAAGQTQARIAQLTAENERLKLLVRLPAPVSCRTTATPVACLPRRASLLCNERMLRPLLTTPFGATGHSEAEPGADALRLPLQVPPLHHRAVLRAVGAALLHAHRQRAAVLPQREGRGGPPARARGRRRALTSRAPRLASAPFPRPFMRSPAAGAAAAPALCFRSPWRPGMGWSCVRRRRLYLYTLEYTVCVLRSRRLYHQHLFKSNSAHCVSP